MDVSIFSEIICLLLKEILVFAPILQSQLQSLKYQKDANILKIWHHLSYKNITKLFSAFFQFHTFFTIYINCTKFTTIPIF